jgi:hypothetical protein
MPDHDNLKQTLPVDELSVTFAVPFPVGLPLGLSCLPFMLTVITFEAANAIEATTRTTAPTASTTAIDFRMVFSNPDRISPRSLPGRRPQAVVDFGPRT